MARNRRDSGFKLSFDGLADSVTNLVGALILLLLLMIGVSRQALSQQTPEPSPPPSGQSDGTRSIVPLQQRVSLLQSEVQAVDAEIESLDGRLDALRDEIDELLNKVDAVQPAPPPEPADEETPPDAREVKFRPPLERRDERPALAFVIQNDRISVINWDSLTEQVRAVAGERNGRVPIDIPLDGMDFRVVGSVTGPYLGDVNLILTRREGAKGEPIANAASQDGEFMRQLRTVSPSTHTISFLVYPDSFEGFLKARLAAWEEGFDVGWNQYASGEEIRLGQDAGGSTVN